MATPLLTATPGSPPTYNPSMADTFSWIPVEGAGRPLFARATYLANASDINISMSASSVTVDFTTLENLITQTNTMVAAITATTNRINGFVIPNYNRIKNFYYGLTNNISKVDYKQDNTVVASLSFTYVGTVTANDALLEEVIKIA
jgi:hypothetical protein